MANPETFNTGLTEEQLSTAFENALGVPEHTANADIHITAAEKQSWNEAAVAVEVIIGAIREQEAITTTTFGFQCKNLLKNAAAEKTQNGITFTINDDMSITANGTATGIAASTISTNFVFEDGKSYIISGCPAGGSDSTYRIDIGNTTDGYNVYDYGDGVTFTPSENKSYTVRIRIAADAVIDNLTFYPMIRDARIADDNYAPYAPNVQEQINAILARIESLETAATEV